ncbi:MAG: YceI family protein [Anaerolineae bacterium]|nr:YceI family protein [Thermoflexales bacterium]MDW8407774.1 YceI family protein [Anaerolineae bacterium]
MAWSLDTSHSSVEFAVKHMMITTVRGQFARFNAAIQVDEHRLENSSLEATVEVASIDTHDANRDKHLLSSDFFDAATYPTMTFRSKRIEKAGEGQYRLIGDLTIRGVTREVAFNLTDEGKGKDPWGNQRWGLTAEAQINRKDWNLSWNVALETGGWLVGEQVKIRLEIELVQTQPQPQAEPEKALA